jgi:methyl-accepting chemotaxis protein
MKLFSEPLFVRRSASILPAAQEETPPPAVEALDATLESFDERMAKLREIFDFLEIDVVRLIGAVLLAGEGANKDIGELAKATRAISAGSAELAASAQDAASHVRRLAESSTDLKASGEEINRRLRDVSGLALDGKHATQDARLSVEALKTSTGEIGSIVGMIGSIARKIDLVALNAMIEAARAGEAGKAFSVVAGEVKSLAASTQRATEDVGRRLAQLQGNSSRLIASVERIGGLIEALSPLILAIASEIETQTGMTARLSHSTDEAAAFANDVGSSANATASVCTSTAATAVSARTSIQGVLADAEKLRTRFIIFLRMTEMGNRRRHDRLPCDLGVTFANGDQFITARAVDISEGGMLVRTESGATLAVGARHAATVEGLGRSGTEIVGRSAIGLHVKWVDPSPEFMTALRAILLEIRDDHADLISPVMENARRIGLEMENAISSGRITMEGLFDTDYQLIEGTAPPQYRTPALPIFEEILGPIQNEVLHSNPRIVFCVAVDRNAWLPVHNPEYSYPQRPHDYDWNCGHARNMRFFDDRAGLAASRNIRPSLIQIYNRDLGGGVFILMKEVNSPIRVFGRHWGGLRVAYQR